MGWASELRVPEPVGSGENLPSGLQVAAFSLCAHMVFCLCVCVCVRARMRLTMGRKN